MRWESVQELKAELLTTDPPAGLLPQETAAYLAAEAERRRRPDIAIGAAPTDRAGDYRLAVRVQRPELMRSERLLAIVRRARGDADVAYVGPGTKQSARPLRAGDSVSHPQVTSGTLGALVQTDAGVALLSNNHVIANENASALGDPVLSPGTKYGGAVPTDVVAHLQHVVPLALVGNLVDAATAVLTDGRHYEPRSLTGMGDLAGVHPEPRERLTVAKVGRASGLTFGRIVGLSVSGFSLAYDLGDLGFDEMIEIEGVAGQRFTIDGDSGSLVVSVEERPRAIGLHIGGTSEGRSVVAPIATVLDRCKCSLIL